MKWKENVVVERNKRYILKQNENIKIVAKEDEYIIKAMEKGITNDKTLTEVVMKKEKINDIIARFRLAQFILDYADFISNDVGHIVIEP